MFTTHVFLRSLSRGAAALGILGLAAGAPASAGAAATTLKVSVKGTQTTTWKYVKAMAPSCDYPEFEEGTQTIALGTKRPAKLKLSAARNGKLRFSSAAVTVPAKANMKRTYDRRFADISNCSGSGSSGGGSGPAQNVAGSSQCAVDGAVELRFGVARKELYTVNEAPPTSMAPKVKAGSALLRGAPKWSKADSWSTLPALCSEAGQPDADIGITEGRGEWAGGLIETTASLPVKTLLKATGRASRVVHVRRSVDYPNVDNPQPGVPTMTGRTVLDLKITLGR